MPQCQFQEELYAGDAAWREWFEICSVSGCSAVSAAALRREIEHALFARLAKCGHSPEIAAGEDPVAFFDAYFKLKGSREQGKPLKRYFAHRILEEGLPMRSFVCGTLFGAAAGRVHDIVTEWISCLKGWRTRWTRSADGSRRVVWESAAGSEETSVELPLRADPAALLDTDEIRRAVSAALDAAAVKAKLDRTRTALIAYAVAMDVPVTDASVLARLGVGRSRAYQLKEAVMKAIGNRLSRSEIAEDPAFGRILLEVCEEALR